MLAFVLSILTSIVANNVPTMRDLVKRNKTLRDKLDDCFQKAVDRWSAPAEMKRDTLLDSVRFTSKLKDYIEHPEKGMHPLDKELMHLWVEAILADGECSAYILSIKEDLIQARQDEGFKKVLARLEKMMENQEEISRKIDDLWRRGGKAIKRFWDEMSIFDGGKKQLPYLTIIAGRESEAEVIVNACTNPHFVVIEAQSRIEAKAFATAAILANGGDDDNVIVVETKELYDQLVNEEKRRIIITSIPVNHQLAVAKGHSVIYCVGPQDNYAEDHIVLPEIDRNVFITSLHDAGLSDDEARKLALDSAKDINMLWRMLGVIQEAPAWEYAENLQLFVSVMLVGRWDEVCEADRLLLKELSGCESYEVFRKELNTIFVADESPLKKIGTVYAVKSPYAMFKRYFRYVTEMDIKHFLRYADLALDDVDSEAKEKMETEELHYWRANRMFSSQLRKGIAEGLTLIALMQEELHQENIIERWLTDKLKDFNLQKYLSHRRNMQWIAEASPVAFLQFIENDIRNGSPILNEIFQIRPRRFSLTDTEIYYTELLFGLESIAWNEEFLPQVTQILLQLCAYPNESNWDNRPSNSLAKIYRFVMPCTLAPMDKRIAILRRLQKRYPKAVHELCVSWFKGLDTHSYFMTPYFRWRWANLKPDYSKISKIYPTSEELHEMFDIMMSDFDWKAESIVDLLKLSMNHYMISLRRDIISTVRTHMDEIRGNDTICEGLREDIYHHMEYQDTWWSLKGEELQVYRDLLQDMTLPDVIHANKHLFDSYYMNNPEVGIGIETENPVDETRRFRAMVEERIMSEKGLDGIWELTKVAKSAEAVAGGFAELTGDKYRMSVYEKYCAEELSEAFARQYFSHLFYSHKDEKELYHGYVSEMMEANPQRIAVVLYAPGFYRELADIAEKQPDDIGLEYWRNVQRSGVYGEDDVMFIIERLLRTKRYFDMLFFMSQKEQLAMMNNRQKVDVLYAIFCSEGILVMARNAYHVGHVLDTVDIEGDSELETKVERMEFYLYERLEHYLKNDHNHFRKAINEKPELMMEIVSAIFKPENESESDLSDDAKANREFMGHIAYGFWYNYQDVPCTNADGNIDGDKLRGFLKRIAEIAEEVHRKQIVPLVIGKILGNFPENDDYPSELLCSLVEEYNDDHIDGEIECAIHNRRSFSSRSPFAGGMIERSHIETLRRYRENAMLRSPRFVKILDNAIKSFEYSAKQNDYEGQMNNFDY